MEGENDSGWDRPSEREAGGGGEEESRRGGQSLSEREKEREKRREVNEYISV